MVPNVLLKKFYSWYCQLIFESFAIHNYYMYLSHRIMHQILQQGSQTKIFTLLNNQFNQITK